RTTYPGSPACATPCRRTLRPVPHSSSSSQVQVKQSRGVTRPHPAEWGSASLTSRASRASRAWAQRPCVLAQWADSATSRRDAERRSLEHGGLVLDQLDTAVEGAMSDHLQGDVRIAVVDAFRARGPGDHREHHDPEAVDE